MVTQIEENMDWLGQVGTGGEEDVACSSDTWPGTVYGAACRVVRASCLASSVLSNHGRLVHAKGVFDHSARCCSPLACPVLSF